MTPLLLPLLALSLWQAPAEAAGKQNNKAQHNDAQVINFVQQQKNIAERLQRVDKAVQQQRADVAKLQQEQHKLLQEQRKLKQSNQSLQLVVDSLQTENAVLRQVQQQDRQAMQGKIAQTDGEVQQNALNLQNRTLGGTIIAVVLGVVIAVGGWLVRRKIQSSHTDLDEVRKAQEALQAAQGQLQEESVKLDNKLLELAEQQLSIAASAPSQAQDHSLVLKVGDELTRIELNLSRMDAAVRGYKQLAKAVQRIKDNFSANGYEIVSMLGTKYDEGMKAIANFVDDETLDKGTQVITAVTKPQINYNGRMIQAAQITVSQNL